MGKKTDEKNDDGEFQKWSYYILKLVQKAYIKVQLANICNRCSLKVSSAYPKNTNPQLSMRNGVSASPHAYLQGFIVRQEFYPGILFIENIRNSSVALCQNKIGRYQRLDHKVALNCLIVVPLSGFNCEYLPGFQTLLQRGMMSPKKMQRTILMRILV